VDAGLKLVSTPRLSIVIPCLNESEEIRRTLASIAPARARGAEIIVVDGGSADDTREIGAPNADRVVVAARGRASQMNAGAAVASGDVLLFLHADSRPPPVFDSVVLDGLARSGRQWGRFDVSIRGRHPLLPVVAATMNFRSRATGIATGDQALFVARALFHAVGGFPAIPLMEDIALSRALRARGRPLCLRPTVSTSGRRWDEHGFGKTVLLMWQLRFAYWRGVHPADLAKRYVPHRRA
jgi:rSAM/selenodomain-associated transferase 2